MCSLEDAYENAYDFEKIDNECVRDKIVDDTKSEIELHYPDKIFNTQGVLDDIKNKTFSKERYHAEYNPSGTPIGEIRNDISDKEKNEQYELNTNKKKEIIVTSSASTINENKIKEWISEYWNNAINTINIKNINNKSNELKNGILIMLIGICIIVVIDFIVRISKKL